jgi:hypothetical protein
VKARTILLIILVALLQGCSVTHVAYDNADVLLRWQANSYFDFHGEQSEEFDRRLAAFLAWHRAKALPQYAGLAEEAAARILRGINRADLEWSYDAVQVQIRQTLAAAAAESAGLLDGLDAEQVAHFEQRLADENRKFVKEQVQGTVEERQQRRVKRNVERLEDWFGPLSDAQVERVRRYSARAPLSAELRDRDRRRRQSELLAMLRAREAKQRLVPWAEAWDGGRDPAYAAASRATAAEYFDLLLDLDRTLSAEQRAHVTRRLKRYASLFETLARQ